ncbi:Lin0512 family protein [Geminicoccus roseus]|uniref:Lin0512 family protein n=1 Tax=Geminicoccus roseus TaxID=404900 RepID=UPI000404CC2A|nr:Lin0512 family protein [Geminicoccus roseus]
MNRLMFVELGMGADLQGQDPTRASVKAVKDAIGHNYLPAMRALVDEGHTMKVHVRLGVPAAAGQVDMETVKAALPHGEVTLEVVEGGMLTPSGTPEHGHICMVVAAIEVGV